MILRNTHVSLLFELFKSFCSYYQTLEHSHLSDHQLPPEKIMRVLNVQTLLTSYFHRRGGQLEGWCDTALHSPEYLKCTVTCFFCQHTERLWKCSSPNQLLVIVSFQFSKWFFSNSGIKGVAVCALKELSTFILTTFAVISIWMTFFSHAQSLPAVSFIDALPFPVFHFYHHSSYCVYLGQPLISSLHF